MDPYFFGEKILAWQVIGILSIIVALIAALVFKPKEFPVGRLGIIGCILIMWVFSFFGGKIASIIIEVATNVLPLELLRVNPWKIFHYSGYASAGILLASLLALFVFTKFRRRRISFLEVGDHIVPGIILIFGLSRLGCFLNGCCYGNPSDLPWAVEFVRLAPPDVLVPRHPTQIYSMIADLAIFFGAITVRYRKLAPKGIPLFGSMFLFCVFRFFISFLREGTARLVVGNVKFIFTFSQVFFFLSAVICALIIAFIYNNASKPAINKTAP